VNRIFESKWFPISLLVGFLIFELLLSVWTGHPYDMEVWFKTGEWMNQGINIYLPPHHIGYAPLWALWCGVANIFYNFFGNNYELWRIIIKLPIIIGHLILALIVGKFAESRFGPKTGRKIFLILLTWSFFIYSGAIWGQINAISALLTFLAFYAVTSHRTKTSAVLLGLAITLKTYPIITLPAFFAFILRNRGKKESGKFVLLACAVPILFTLSIFAIFQWDIVYFLRTIFFSTPVFESDLLQFNVGCMNAWSFIALLGIDIVPLWHLRQLWIPIIGLGAFFWIRKTKLSEKDLTLSIISFYILFMISYGWVSEQAFVDLLPFTFLLIIGYSPKRIYLYMLALIQGLIYVFSFANQSLAVFGPLVERFAPSILTDSQKFLSDNGSLIWTVRGTMGLIVTFSLIVFLVLLIRPEIAKRAEERFNRFLKFITEKIRGPQS